MSRLHLLCYLVSTCFCLERLLFCFDNLKCCWANSRNCLTPTPGKEASTDCREQQERRFSGFHSVCFFCVLFVLLACVCFVSRCAMLLYCWCLGCACFCWSSWFDVLVFLLCLVFLVVLEQTFLCIGCAVLLLSIMLWLTWVFVRFGTQELLASRLLVRYLLFLLVWVFLVLVVFESLELRNTYISKGRVNRLFSVHSPQDMFALESSTKRKCNHSIIRFQGGNLWKPRCLKCFGLNQNVDFHECQTKLRVNRLATHRLTDCPRVLVVFGRVRWIIY